MKDFLRAELFIVGLNNKHVSDKYLTVKYQLKLIFKNPKHDPSVNVGDNPEIEMFDSEESMHILIPKEDAADFLPGTSIILQSTKVE